MARHGVIAREAPPDSPGCRYRRQETLKKPRRIKLETAYLPVADCTIPVASSNRYGQSRSESDVEDVSLMSLLDPGMSRTDWSIIEAASSPDRDQAARAMDRIARRYWPAVYAFIRRSGHDVHESADLTQGFICDVLLARKLAQSADKTRGRFRSFMLTSLQNYLREQHRKQTRRKRAPRDGHVVALGELENSVAELSAESAPEAAFGSQWVMTLVQQVLERVREECKSMGQDAHWAVFEDRVIRPMLNDELPTPYGDLVARLKLKNRAQASNMIVTIKRRFVRALMDEIAQTIDNGDEPEEELFDLLRDLERAA